MHRSPFFLLCFLFGIALPLTLAPAGEAHADTAAVLYGNETALANDIVITIDDCSVESNVRWAFDILRNRGLKATFFPNTKHMLRQNPQLWRDIVAAGFEIGYHTRMHTPGMTVEQLNADFDLFTAEVRGILNDSGYTIRYVRPPAGVWNTDWMNWSASRGLITVRWNMVLPNVTVNYVEGVISNRASGGSILLMHTGRADVQWLQDHVDTLTRYHEPDGTPYHLTDISDALTD